MQEKQHTFRHLIMFFALLFLVAGPPVMHADAAERTAHVSADRATGECSYTVQGLDINQTNSITLQVLRGNTNDCAYQETIPLTSGNCVNGTYSGKFSLSSVKNSYDIYTVNIVAGNETISAGTCDFSIHKDKLSMSVAGETGSASRTVTISQTDAADTVIPGTGHLVSVLAWPEGADESTAKVIASKLPCSISGAAPMTMTVDLSAAGSSYGNWNCKLVLEKADGTGAETVCTATYAVQPSCTSFDVDKTPALEKKKAFAVTLEGLKNVYGIKKVAFEVYNSKGKKVTTITGKKKKADGSKQYAEISLKKLGYAFDNYTIKAVLTDSSGNTRTLAISAVADITVSGGKLTVTKKSNATCRFKLSNAYIPGNIKKARFVVYEIKGGKTKKIGTYDVKKTAGKSKISATAENKDTGKYKVRVYGYTAWGKKVFLNEQTYTLRKKHMGKNGWYYEKYAGKKYKFYYINNEKQTDLTKILKLKKSDASNTNLFYIEVNRAACNVTIYMYDKDTKKYDIPVKTCPVSVGSDIWTDAGTSGLNEDSSYTPLGNYSICTNGQSVKYTLKEMHEPDGRILYARWTTHIVGNVYFHSIAVSAKSHYSLPASTYNRLGSPASAGCIRMAVADAKWIYDYASTGSKVKIVKGNSKKPGPLGKGSVIKNQGGINYDPTDPAVPDSRKKADYKAKRISGYMTKRGKRVGY